MMKEYVHPFWMTVTAVLSLILIVLLYPIVSERYGALGGGLIVAGAVLVVWIVYAVRAYMFVRFTDRNESSST